MAFDFSNFSAQSFERLIQALCVKIFGPGVTVFGRGPDGGREAEIDGKVAFPSLVDSWNGHIIIQAKCKETLTNDKRDADWLAGQLKAELQAFARPKSSRRKPQYYLLCTNVTLSSKSKSGGKAKIDKVFDSYQRKLKLKGWHVWSADELHALLENATDVRTAYTAWLTPGDVLSRLIELLAKPTLKQLLPLSLARDLREERDVRLRDAGQDDDRGIALDSVFVDLPIGKSARNLDTYDEITVMDRATVPPRYSSTGGRESLERPDGVVARILERIADRFSSTSDELGVGEEPDARPTGNRIVLLGGPGQGKSTVGQFVAQLSRARLLQAQHFRNLSPETRKLATSIIKRANAEQLSLRGPLRFPVKIDLPVYADTLQRASSANGGLSLLSYAAGRLSRDLDEIISPSDLRSWLGACPSIIILDGLDEVPPSSNRRAVIAAIDALWDDLHFVNSDAIVLVTTRPQGYSHELSPEYWQHWELSALTPVDALRYAAQFAEVRVPELERRRAITAELTRASHDPATKMLMISPLQVTIMFGIAQLKGAIPRDRWDLFDRYYTLLRDREALKPTISAKFIRDYKRQIDALHQEAGFVLQLRAEAPGSATPFLTAAAFGEMAERLLREDQFDEETVGVVSGELVRIATDRLVLLRARVEGRISFDVRSLQEYMAAAAITSGPSNVITDRIYAIAPSAHWRHALRIVASRIFSEVGLNHIRQDIVAACHSMDGGVFGDDQRLAQAGARLALDLALDGVASSAPRYQKALIRLSFSLLDLGVQSFDARLVDLVSSTSADIVREELIVRVQQRDTPASLAAWSFMLYAFLQHREFVDSIVAEHLSDLSPALVFRLMSTFIPSHIPQSVEDLLFSTQWSAGPLRCLDLIEDAHVRPPVNESSEGRDSIAERLVLWAGVRPSRRTRGRRSLLEIPILKGDQGSVLSADIISIRSEQHLRKTDDFSTTPSRPKKFDTSDWLAFDTIIAFWRAPSAGSLGEAVRRLAQAGLITPMVIAYVPWVLAALLQEVLEGEDPSAISERASAGEFGDIDSWYAAEERWSASGINVDDIRSWVRGNYLSAAIAYVGAPFIESYGVRASVVFAREDIMAICEALMEVPQPLKRVRPLGALLFVVSIGQNHVAELDELLSKALSRTIASSTAALPNQLYECGLPYARAAWSDNVILDAVDRLGVNLSSPQRFWFGDAIVVGFNSNPVRRGLLSYIVTLGLRADAQGDDRGRLARLDDTAFEICAPDTRSVRMAVMWLRLIASRWQASDVIVIADTIADGPSEWSDSDLFSEMLSVAVSQGHDNLVDLLQELTSRLRQNNPFAASRAAAALARLVSARLTALQDPKTRTLLGLPS